MEYATQPPEDADHLIRCTQVDDAQNECPVNVDRITYLESAIEKLTRDVSELRDTLKSEVREVEQFESAILPRIEMKERELRHFLIPRSSHLDASQTPVFSESHANVPSTGVAIPIQSTVPAVRPVLSLVGGLAKTNSNGTPPVNSSLTPLGSRSPTKPTSLPIASSTSNSGQHSKQNFCGIDARKGRIVSVQECASETDLYSKMPVDPSVLLVFSRLRRAQEHCRALVTTNQTDLQSFTFTQNSQNGKRIMMRVRVLEQENQELAILNRTGRAARLDTEMTLRRHLLQDLKKAHIDMEHMVEEVEIETEMFGSSLLVLQQRLNLVRTMAQVLASALAADEPSRPLLKALMSSTISPQSIGWLNDSLNLQRNDEEAVCQNETHLSTTTHEIDYICANPTSTTDLQAPTAPSVSPIKNKRIKRNRHLSGRHSKRPKDEHSHTSSPTESFYSKCKKTRMIDEESEKVFTESRNLQNKEHVLSPLVSKRDVSSVELAAIHPSCSVSLTNRADMSTYRGENFEQTPVHCVISNYREVTGTDRDETIVQPTADNNNNKRSPYQIDPTLNESEPSWSSETEFFNSEHMSMTNGDQSI